MLMLLVKIMIIEMEMMLQEMRMVLLICFGVVVDVTYDEKLLLICFNGNIDDK